MLTRCAAAEQITMRAKKINANFFIAIAMIPVRFIELEKLKLEV